MTFVKLLPVILSSFLLGAHFSRAGLEPLALIAALLPLVLLWNRAWVARLFQAVLVLGAAEWIRTLLLLVAQRREMEQSWIRLAIILGVVALFTLGSAFVFSMSKALRKRYRLA